MLQRLTEVRDKSVIVADPICHFSTWCCQQCWPPEYLGWHVLFWGAMSTTEGLSIQRGWPSSVLQRPKESLRPVSIVLC
jgi:hypothetical protein